MGFFDSISDVFGRATSLLGTSLEAGTSVLNQAASAKSAFDTLKGGTPPPSSYFLPVPVPQTPPMAGGSLQRVPPSGGMLVLLAVAGVGAFLLLRRR